jgi:hypothetical protein
MERRQSDGRTSIRVLVWGGAALSLCGAAVVAFAFAGSIRNHPIALLQGLPGWVVWGGWLVLLGVAAVLAGATRHTLHWRDGPRRVGLRLSGAALVRRRCRGGTDLMPSESKRGEQATSACAGTADSSLGKKTSQRLRVAALY